jgi:hypothetical protein
MTPAEVAQQVLWRLAGSVSQWAPAAIGLLLAFLALLALGVALVAIGWRAR